MSTKTTVQSNIPDPYRSFTTGKWNEEIDVRDFIAKNYSLYTEDESFLEKPTTKTTKVWDTVKNLMQQEFDKGGVLDVDVETPSTITSHKAGYIDKRNESIVGLQTDKPLQRGIKPKGGVRLVAKSLEAIGYTLNPDIFKTFTELVQTHNDAVFEQYLHWEDFRTPDGNLLRSEGIITGLPDNYSRGRIIGDYRRVALYGIDKLLEVKKDEEKKICGDYMNQATMHRREYFHKEVKALEDIKVMAECYGFDISRPATHTRECIQWLYFAYLAAVKEQDGAAMSIGRIDAFIDIYAERDLSEGTYSEAEIQQFIDDFVIKLRIVRHVRHPEYDALFAGDPTWVTCSIAGMHIADEEFSYQNPDEEEVTLRYTSDNLQPLVTKTSFRLLHTLTNLGPAPEPNLTVLWADELPEAFKSYASRVAIESSSLQFESDELMRPYHGDDYGIACCVSSMTIGKQMQFFGARCNLPKVLLLVINEGRNELTGDRVVDGVEPLEHRDVLDYEEVKEKFYGLMDWLAKMYVQTMNIIHYCHDHYHYENSQMALHDAEIHRFMAFGAAGISIIADSLSAMKYAKVKPRYNEKGIATDFDIEGEFPCFGNDDDRVDDIAIEVCQKFIDALKRYPTYKNAEHTLSLLTITSNVVYGKHTGATPDGRKAYEPFAPGANPMHGRDTKGALASLNSVAKLPYTACRDGISNTFSITPNTLGKSMENRTGNLVSMLDGYFKQGGFHLNVNVLNRETLEDAMKRPWEYPQLTIRVSGYAVHFIKLTEEQQKEVISRTIHERVSW